MYLSAQIQSLVRIQQRLGRSLLQQPLSWGAPPTTTTACRAALAARCSLPLHGQARCYAEARVSAFEQAMKEVYGDEWKDHLNRQQREFVEKKESRRRKSQERELDGTNTYTFKAKESEEEWKARVEERKQIILSMKKEKEAK